MTKRIRHPGALTGLLVSLAVLALTAAFMKGCYAAERPDPYVRFSNCSGGVFYASWEHGVWIGTAEHCSPGKGREVKVYFYWDGHESDAMTGYVYGEHPRADGAVYWVPPHNYRAPELPATVPLAEYPGPHVGQTVYSVGSFAGPTRKPAVQKMLVTRWRGDYQYNLDEGAWNGHSGGAVVDEEMNLVGNLWGGERESYITSHRALWEIMDPPNRQAFMSVPNKKARDCRNKTTVWAWGNPDSKEMQKFAEDANSNPYLKEHFDFVLHPSKRWKNQWVWTKNGREGRLWSWDPEKLAKDVGVCDDCWDQFAGQRQRNPFQGKNPFEQQPQRRKIEDQLDELKDKLRDQELEHEREKMKLQNELDRLKLEQKLRDSQEVAPDRLPPERPLPPGSPDYPGRQSNDVRRLPEAASEAASNFQELQEAMRQSVETMASAVGGEQKPAKNANEEESNWLEENQTLLLLVAIIIVAGLVYWGSQTGGSNGSKAQGPN